MTENIVSHAQKSALQFTLTMNYREDALLYIDDLDYILYTQTVSRTPTAVNLE